jgi:hypothetical protein
MINTERNRALLTDLFAALGREGWGEVFLAAIRTELWTGANRLFEMFLRITFTCSRNTRLHFHGNSMPLRTATLTALPLPPWRRHHAAAPNGQWRLQP